MLEQIAVTPLSEQIKNFIKSKDWYSLTESKRFIWENSVALMAEMIREKFGPVEKQQIREIIEGSFTQESLSRAGEGYFIDCLLEIDQQLILWSEGDPEWQKLKATKSRLLERQGIKAEFISKEKTSRLKDLILSLTSKSGEKVCVIVVDDKLKNLAHAASFEEELASHGILITTFLLKLDNIEANPDACLKFISEIQQKIKNVRVIVDMDGVIVDTDGVLAKIVPEKIAEILEKN